MGHLHLKGLRWMSALVWSRLGYAAGCATASSGVGLTFGLGWALTVAGVLAAVSCLLLVDVEPKGAPGEQ
jgi:hypothetical protein